MKKIEKFAQKCYESYFHAGSGWFLGAILSLTMLPRVLRALWMIQKQAELSDFQVGLSTVIGYAAAAICAYFTASATTIVKKDAMQEIKPVAKRKRLKYLLPILGTYGFWILFEEAFRNFLGRQIFLEKFELIYEGSFIAVLPRVTLMFLLDVILAIFLMLFLKRSSEEASAQEMPAVMFPFKDMLHTAWKNLLPELVFALSFFVSKLVYNLLFMSFIRGFGKSGTVVSYLTKLLLLALLVFLIMAPSFSWMRGKALSGIAQASAMAGTAEKTAEEASANTDAHSRMSAEWQKKVLPLLAGAVVPIVLLILLKVVGRVQEPAGSDYVLNDIAYYTDSARAREYQEDYIGILRDLDRLDALTAGWRAYLNEDTETIESLADGIPGTEQLEILLLYAQAKDKQTIGVVQEKLLDNLYRDPDDLRWYFMYLQLIPKDGKGLEKKEAKSNAEIRSVIVNKLVAADYYRHENVTPYDLTQKDETRIAEKLSDETLAMVREQFLTAQMKAKVLEIKDGYETNYYKRVNEMLEFADENPENFAVQEETINIVEEAYGKYREEVNWQSKSKYLSEDIIEPAKRYGEILENYLETRTELTEEEKNLLLAESKYEVASVLYRCRQLEELQEYLTDAVKSVDSELLTDFLMLAALYNKDYATARPILEANLKNHPEEMRFVSLMALMSYREGNIDQSLQYAIKLADMAVAEDADPTAGFELLAMVDTYVYGDHTLKSTGEEAKQRGKKIYPYKLTEEQKEMLAGSELVSTLVECEYTYWQGGNLLARAETRPQYREAQEKLEALIQKYPKLSTPYYILGRLYGNYSEGERYDDSCIDLEKAEELYRACLAIDEKQPVVWFTLGALYDHIKRYEECYQCNEMVLELGTYGHYGIYMGDDNYGYGLYPHAKSTMDRVKSYLENHRQGS